MPVSGAAKVFIDPMYAQGVQYRGVGIRKPNTVKVFTGPQHAKGQLSGYPKKGKGLKGYKLPNSFF